MYPYETLFVLRYDLPDAQIRETLDRARNLIANLGGSVVDVQDWGVRDLAYPIQKLARGYYVLIEYDAKPAVVWEFERTLKIADEVIRFVSVRRRPKVEKKPKKIRREGAPAPARESGSGDEAESGVDDFANQA